MSGTADLSFATLPPPGPVEIDRKWDAFVSDSPQGSDLLRSDVIAVLAPTLTPKARVLRCVVAGPDDKWVAAWGMLARRRLGIRYVSSFPLFYSGPMLCPEISVRGEHSARLEALRLMAVGLRSEIDLLDVETPPEFNDARGLFYGGMEINLIHTHVWPVGTPAELEGFPNRSKRREIKAARGNYRFEWMPANQGALEAFDSLHDVTLPKFRWIAPAAWKRSLRRQTAAMERLGVCRLFAARERENGPVRAVVSVLLSPIPRVAWLWRVAARTDTPGLVPALYVAAGAAVKEEFGADWRINFGGSPAANLALFKDHLGAEPVGHWRIRWQRPGWKRLLWNSALGLRDLVPRRLGLPG